MFGGENFSDPSWYLYLPSLYTVVGRRRFNGGDCCIIPSIGNLGILLERLSLLNLVQTSMFLSNFHKAELSNSVYQVDVGLLIHCLSGSFNALLEVFVNVVISACCQVLHSNLLGFAHIGQCSVSRKDDELVPSQAALEIDLPSPDVMSARLKAFKYSLHLFITDRSAVLIVGLLRKFSIRILSFCRSKGSWGVLSSIVIL